MAEAGWYPDSQDENLLRFFDGDQWLEFTRPRPTAPDTSDMPPPPPPSKMPHSSLTVAAPGAGMLTGDDATFDSQPPKREVTSASMVIGSQQTAPRPSDASETRRLGMLIGVSAVAFGLLAGFLFGGAPTYSTDDVTAAVSVDEGSSDPATSDGSQSDPDQSGVTTSTPGSPGPLVPVTAPSPSDTQTPSPTAAPATPSPPATSPSDTALPADGIGGDAGDACRVWAVGLAPAVDEVLAASADATTILTDSDSASVLVKGERFWLASTTFDDSLSGGLAQLASSGFTIERMEARTTKASLDRRAPLLDDLKAAVDSGDASGVTSAVLRLSTEGVVTLGTVQPRMRALGGACVSVADAMEAYESGIANL